MNKSLVDKSKKLKWCLVGIPDHEGVSVNSGRLGAASGPAAFRKRLSVLKGKEDLSVYIEDLGDVQNLTTSVKKNHSLASEKFFNSLKNHSGSIVIGGGHDHAYSHLKSLKKFFPKKKIGCINIDAHFDLRKPTSSEPGSGSPFYLAIEEELIKGEHLVEFGIQEHCNSEALWIYAKQKKIKTITLSQIQNQALKVFQKALKDLEKKVDLIYFSFDLDAIESASAPGVSAPQVFGITQSEWFQILECAAKSKKIHSFGIFELNPIFDVDEKTAQLAALSVYYFMTKRNQMRSK